MLRLSLALSVLVACGNGGSGSGNLADAPQFPDGAVDGAPDAPVDAMPASVRLTIQKNGNPARDVVVHFQNSDSSLVATLTTDANGIAETIMAAGGFVTAINPFTTPIAVDQLRTFAGVKPGDRLVLTHEDPPAPFDVNVTVPEISRGFDYAVNTTCGSGFAVPPLPGIRLAAAGSIQLAGCTTTDFLVISRINDEGIRVVSAFYHPDVKVEAGARIDFTQPPEDTYKPLIDVKFDYTGAPDNLRSLFVSHYLASTHGKIEPSFGGTVSLTGGAGSLELREPDVQGLIGIVDTRGFMSGQHHVLQWGPNATEYSLDMTGMLLPDVESESSRYLVPEQQAAWTEVATGATPDLTTLELEVRRAPPEEPERVWQWRIAAPYTAGKVQFPTLPIDTYTATENDFRTILKLINAKVPGGYDAVRAHILDVQESGNITGFVAGATGRVVTVGEEVAGDRQRAVRRAASPVRAPAVSGSGSNPALNAERLGR
jgi:hypothetical protein